MAQLELAKVGLAQVASCSHRNTLVLYPAGKKKKQRFATGDDTGTLNCFEMKKGEATMSYTFAPPEDRSPINVVTMNQVPEQGDRLFMSQGNRIFGISKKPNSKTKKRDFFSLQSTLTEPINHMTVDDTTIYAGCEFILNVYKNGTDTGYHMNPDRINDLVLAPVGAAGPAVVLACQDRCLRVIATSAADGKIVGSPFILELSHPISSLGLFKSHLTAPADAASNPAGSIPRALSAGPGSGGLGAGADGNGGRGSVYMVYGSETGDLGGLQLYEDFAQRRFQVSGVGAKAGTTVVRTADMTKDGVPDLVVARSDGQFQIWGFDFDRSEPELQFSAELEETVQGLQVGTVCAADYDEVLALTYSGKVVSFTNEPMNLPDSPSAPKKGSDGEEHLGDLHARNAIRMSTVQKELKDLEAQLQREKEKFSKQNKGYVPIHQKFDVQKRFVMEPDEAAFLLTVEIPMPIDIITMSSTCHLDLLDLSTSEAIVSYTPPTEGNTMLATYRFQEESKVARLKLRTTEGESGDILLGVVANVAPKVCQLLRFHVKPLSLHYRVHELPPPAFDVLLPEAPTAAGLGAPAAAAALGDEQQAPTDEPEQKGGGDVEGGMRGVGTAQVPRDDEGLATGERGASGGQKGPEAPSFEVPYNVLTLKGSFSMSMIHEWVRASVPEVPPQVQRNTEDPNAPVTYYFVNVFTGGTLVIEYGQNQCVVKSESISTIAIFKEVVNQKAMELRADVVDQLRLTDDSVRYFLRRFHPKLQYQLDLAQKVELIDAIKEIHMQEEDKRWMSAEYLGILDKADQIRREFKDRPRALEFITGIITDLFVDWHKFHGNDVKHKIPELNQFLTLEYSYEGLVQLFNLQPPSNPRL